MYPGRPSDFTSFPWNSVTNNAECEIIAQNVMTILKRTGDEWRELTEEEYIRERKKDGNWGNSELGHFRKVLPYCKSEDTARLFCPDWDNVVPVPKKPVVRKFLYDESVPKKKARKIVYEEA